MKTKTFLLLFFLAFGSLISKAATHSDGDGNVGWFTDATPRTFRYERAWINGMMDRITKHTTLTATQKADGFAAMEAISIFTDSRLRVNGPNFTGRQSVGLATADVMVEREPDYFSRPPPDALVGAYYSVNFTIEIAEPVAANRAPTIAWTIAPNTAEPTKNYIVSARGSDADDNLTNVNVWKEGLPFAFANGGNGTNNDSGNPSLDARSARVTFTAQAVDSTGARSAIISHTVTIADEETLLKLTIEGPRRVQAN